MVENNGRKYLVAEMVEKNSTATPILRPYVPPVPIKLGRNARIAACVTVSSLVVCCSCITVAMGSGIIYWGALNVTKDPNDPTKFSKIEEISCIAIGSLVALSSLCCVYLGCSLRLKEFLNED